MHARCPVADAHVDVLWRMENEGAAFYGASSLQASAARLRAGGVMTQVFALYESPDLPPDYQLEKVLRAIDRFYADVVRPGMLRLVKTQADLALAREHGEIAALLSLEGAGSLRGRESLLRILFRLGVRGIGLTWNTANDLADGCREARGGGLTDAGKRIICEAERLGMWVDLAHLSDAGIRDVFACVGGRVMASHANCRAIYEHPRNLTDDVIRELIRRRGWIGLVFEGSFVCDPSAASIEGVLRHLDHVLELGGEDCVGFGSDFDGTLHAVPGLAHAGDYAAFAELVVDRYGEHLGRKILFSNFERFLRDSLPQS